MGKSQESLPIYQQYLFDGEFLFNPAHLGKSDNLVINTNYQKQYSKLDESPSVQSIGIHANVFDRVGGGLVFFRDQNGPISANGAGLGASYFIPLADYDDDRKDQFSFGAAVNFYNMNFDYSRIIAAVPGDPLLGKNNIFLVYANLGLQATYRNFFAGASLVDISLKEDIPIINGIEPTPTKIFINGGYDWVFENELVSLTPSFFMGINTNSARMLDLNLIANLYGINDDSIIGFGASYRMEKNNIGGQKLSLSPIIKVKYKNLNFGATYNFGLSGIQQYGGSSFMISLGLDIGNFLMPNGMR